MFFRVKPWHPDSGQSPSRVVIGNLAALGSNIAVGFGFFVLLGFWADRRQATGEVWTLVGALLGLLYMVYEVWKAIRIINKDVPAPLNKTPSGKGKK